MNIKSDGIAIDSTNDIRWRKDSMERLKQIGVHPFDPMNMRVNAESLKRAAAIEVLWGENECGGLKAGDITKVLFAVNKAIDWYFEKHIQNKVGEHRKC